MTPAPGSVVTVWEGGELALGVVIGEDKQRLRLLVSGGREIRVQPTRVGWVVEQGGTVPGATSTERAAADRRLDSLERSIAELAERVDVDALWAIGVETSGDAESRDGFELCDLAELALERPTGEALTAVARALRAEGVRFTRKGERWVPRSAERVEDLDRERERIAAREAQTRAMFDALRGAVRGEGFVPSDSEYEKRYLDALEQLAVQDEAATQSARALGLQALEASGLRHDRPHEGAFRLLQLTGRFDDPDVSLPVLRFGLRESFPPEVLARAEEAARRELDVEGREDLTGLETISIDGPRTLEIDDALSVGRRDGTTRLGVHIADPGSAVRHGDEVDREALTRGLTHYHPDRRLPMLPPVLGEDACSLASGRVRPALSFLVDLDASGNVLDARLTRSIIRVASRLDYAAADAIVASGTGPHAGCLAELARIGAAREGLRLERGAVLLRGAEVELWVDEARTIRLERPDPGSASRRAVSEAMILAGEVAARICRDARLPAIYRRQAAADKARELPDGVIVDPVDVRRVRRSLNRGEVSLQPGAHDALALEAYVQVTSPLRRYQDLVIHRQLAAHLSGVAPPYDPATLQRVAASTERAEQEARQAERSADEYWLLRYLEQRTGETVEGIVVETEPRPVVHLLETLREQPMPSLAGLEVGRRVVLRIERVNPRAGLLVLRRHD